MPLTTLDSNAALILIDLQKGIVGIPGAHPMGEIVGRSAELARSFRERGLPVVLVNVTGAAPGRTDTPRPKFAFPPDWAELVPELEAQASDYRVSKQRWGGFIGTEMETILREREVTQIFLAGVATSIGVESTARSLYDAGYNVVLVVDAMTDRDAEAHEYRVKKVFPRMGEVETAENVLRMLRG
jgi:nicotinamidase-related amidase